MHHTLVGTETVNSFRLYTIILVKSCQQSGDEIIVSTACTYGSHTSKNIQ